MIWRKPKVPRAVGWRTMRAIHLREHPRCEACGTRRLLEVHHVVPVHVDRSLELNPANFITLCRWRRHHFKVGHLGDWTRWNDNVRQDAARLRSSHK